MKKGWIVPVVAAVAFFAFIFGANALMNKDSFFIDDYFEVTMNAKNKPTITWNDAKLEKLNAKLTKKLRSNPDYYRQEANASSKAKEAYLKTVEEGLENGLSVKDLVTMKATVKTDKETGESTVEVSINTSKSDFLRTVMQQSVSVRNSSIPIQRVKKAE